MKSGPGDLAQDDVGRILQTRAQAHPERTLFCFYAGDGKLRERYSYGAFHRRVSHVARRLLEAGVAARQPVLLVYPPGIEIAVAFYACVCLGAIPVPAPPPSKQATGWARLAHIARHAGAGQVLTAADIAKRALKAQAEAEDASLSAIFSGLDWIATDVMVGEADGCHGRPSEVLFIQYTSGSTSAPRGVAVTHRNVIHNAGLCVDHEEPVGVSWLPHFHDMGLLGYFLYSLIKGGEAHCFSPLDFLRRPVLWLDLISRTRATITTAPNAGFEYCLREDKVTDAQLAGIDLGSIRTMVNCAEPVRAATFERFWRRFCRCGLDRRAYAAGYGLAEHTLCVTTGGSRVTGGEADQKTQPTARHGRFVSCGRPAADVDLRIVDPDTGHLVAPGNVGEIWVDSPSKAAGYWRLHELSEAHFGAKIAGDRTGRSYLRTGDLGFLDDGELYVCGRLRDMLVLGGKNVFPADVEALLEERFAGQLSGRVVAFGAEAPEGDGEQLVILTEGGADAPGLNHIRAVVQDTLGVSVGTIARVPRGTIVWTSSGKIARRLCREKWDAGQVRPTEIVSAGDKRAGLNVEEVIEELVAQARSLGDPNATLDQLGLDSVAFVNLSLALERLLEEADLDSPDLIEQVADLSLLQALRVPDLSAALRAFRSGAGGAVAVLKLLDSAGKKLRQDEHARMRADAALPLAWARSAAAAGSGAFVTGATGFLGAFLVKSLIHLTDEPITVLVRCDNPAHGVARMRRALLDTDMTPSSVDAALRSRIRLVVGDLSRPRLGLSNEDWQTLADTVARVYHAGAEVDYVKSYNLLRPVNVHATREAIALVAAGCPKSLHYVSTTFIFGWSTGAPVLHETDDNPGMEDLDFGYSQSKWVAEQLVLRAHRQGLPATVYRPALVTASAGGRFVTRDVTVRVLGYMIRNGLAVDAINQVSFVPVDICAQNIVALSRANGVAPVLHMTDDHYHTILDICAIIERHHGYPFAKIGLKDFVAHAHVHCRPDDGLYPLLSFLDRNADRILRMGAKLYDSRGYQLARDRCPAALAHPSLEDTVDTIVMFLQREGLIPPAPRRSTLGDREAAAEVPA